MTQQFHQTSHIVLFPTIQRKLDDSVRQQSFYFVTILERDRLAAVESKHVLRKDRIL